MYVQYQTAHASQSIKRVIHAISGAISLHVKMLRYLVCLSKWARTTIDIASFII